MAESHGFVKLPPDGTGKRIPHTVMFEVSYNTGVTPFVVGDVVTFGTSAFSGTVVEVEGSTSTGNLQIKLEEPVPTAPLAVVGESLNVNAVEYAKASTTGYSFYFQQMVLSGGNDPTNTVTVDAQGSLHTRFPDGAPQFDAFGKMQISKQTTLAEYVPSYDLDSERVGSYTVGTGAVSHLPLSGGLLLAVGTENTASAKRSSHSYHPYQAGQSQFAQVTVACGDVGKTNCSRVWGYGDDTDALLFKLSGTSFGVLKRGSTTGSVVEEFIPQSEWNVDRLDGSAGEFNHSGITLDITKTNIYWLDFQMEGAGRVRFGIFKDGVRVTCHQIDHTNIASAPYMRSGALPISVGIINTGVTGSSSELRVWNASVKTEGEYDPEYRSFCIEVPTATFTSSSFVPYVSFRSKQQFNSIDNRVSAYGSLATVISTGAPVLVAFFKNATLTGPTWAMSPDTLSSVEGDMAATAISGGRIVWSRVINAGDSHSFDLQRIFNHRGEAMRRHALITNYDSYSVAIKLLSGTTTDIYCTMGWRES